MLTIQKIKNVRLTHIALIVVIILLQYKLWFEKDGLIDMLKLKRKVAIATKLQQSEEHKNRLLAAEITTLQKSDKQAIESHARHNLGMIKRQEKYYQFAG